MATAIDIKIREALALLDGPLSSLARGIASRQYALWIGAGISRDRVADLREVVTRVLRYLQQNINPAVAADPYRVAAEQAIGLAKLPPADLALIDYSRPIDEWPPLPTLVRNLCTEYARLLDIRIDGHPADHLLWNVVDVPNTFAAAATAPDCEHLCIGILALEGVLPDIASANWDGLIESALTELAGGIETSLQVCVRAEDLGAVPLPTRLLKFHGCAVRAGIDEAMFRRMLIASMSQITDWQNNPDYALMRHELVSLAARKRTLMMGMSAQDGDIQRIFADGHALRQWQWPCDPPAHVFAEDALLLDQLNILRIVYRAGYEANRQAIEEGALFRAFAKPALTALVLHVLCAKASAFSRLVRAPNLTDADRDEIGRGIRVLRDQIAENADVDRLAFIKLLVDSNIRNGSLFQLGHLPAAGARFYKPISGQPANLATADPSLSTSGIREMSSALGLLGLGHSSGTWEIEGPDLTNPNAGALSVDAATGRARIFFAANEQASVALEINGLVQPGDADVIVIHSTSPVVPMVRSPRASPGRTGKSGPRHVGLAEVLQSSSDFAVVQRRFREEALL